jgi:hypothetical protein
MAGSLCRPPYDGLPLTCSGCLLAVVAFVARALLSARGAEGVGDALVGGISLPVDAVGVDLEQDGDAVTCVMAARERQRDKQLGVTARRLSWPTVVLAGGVGLSLAANLAQAQPTAWGRAVAAVPSGAFLVAVPMIEWRAARRTRPASPAAEIPAEDGNANDLSEPDGRPRRRTARARRCSRPPAGLPTSTSMSTGSRSPGTRCAPASASPTRPPPSCSASSVPTKAARQEPHAPPDRAPHPHEYDEHREPHRNALVRDIQPPDPAARTGGSAARTGPPHARSADRASSGHAANPLSRAVLPQLPGANGCGQR